MPVLHASVYYVSPSGNDTGNDGLSVGAPFRTIQKSASIMAAGDTCLIMAGIYRETVSPAASGSPGLPITFMPYNNASVTITGADLYAGSWSAYSGNIWQSATTDSFIQVFTDGQMMNEARWPNTVVDDLLHMATATAKSGTNDTGIIDASLPAGSWAGAYVWIQPGDGWGSYTRQITSYTSGSSLSWSTPIGTGDVNYEPRNGNPYYIFGSLSGLDSAGEWFLDAGGDVFYLWTPDGAAPGTHTVEIKKRNYAFDLTARSHVRIYDLNIFSAAVNMEDSYYCSVDNCRVRYVDHYTQANGFSVSGGTKNYMSGGSNEWKDSTITVSAGCGIYIQGFNNKVTNCLIHDTGYMGSNHAAIMTDGGGGSAQTFGHVLSWNTIYNTGRFGIVHPDTRDLKILYNDISYPGLLSKDCGAIYAFGLGAQYTEIAYNWTHENHTTYGAGIYLDNGSNRHLVHHNVSWNCAGTGIVLNTPSEYNLVYNNTTFNCYKSFDYYGNAAQGLGNIESQLGSEVINNVAANPMTFSHDPPATSHHNGNYPIGADFIPSAGSAAIDAGAVIPGVTDGYSGSAPDIGAYEYGGTYWIPGYTPPAATPTPGGPPLTPTATPTATKTATINLTPTVSGTMVDDLSDCNSSNYLGGSWFTYSDAGSGGVSWIWPSGVFTPSSPGYGSIDCAARVSGVVKFAEGGYRFPEIAWGTGLGGNRDLTPCLGLRFNFNGDNRFYKLRLGADNSIISGYNDYKYTFFAPQGWHEYEIPFTSFTQEAGWGIIVDKGLYFSLIKEIIFGTAMRPREGSQYPVDAAVDGLEIYGCGLATATLTATATPTYDPRPPQGPIDDCEDADSVNLWGGYWFTYDDHVQPTPGVSTAWPPAANFTMSQPGYDSTGYSARMTGTVAHAAGGYEYPFIGMGTDFLKYYDFTPCTGLRFWYRNDGKQYYVKARCDASIPTGYNYYRYTLPASASWTQIVIPFAAFTQATGWGIPVNINLFFQKITGMHFQTDTFPAEGSQWNVDLWVDNIEVYGCPALPSPTATATPAISQAASDLDNAHAYPSLFDKRKEHTTVTFTGLTEKCSIRVFSMAGDLVFKADVNSPSGEYTWDIAGQKRSNALAPGLYIYTVSNENQIKRGKIAVIR